MSEEGKDPLFFCQISGLHKNYCNKNGKYLTQRSSGLWKISTRYSDFCSLLPLFSHFSKFQKILKFISCRKLKILCFDFLKRFLCQLMRELNRFYLKNNVIKKRRFLKFLFSRLKYHQVHVIAKRIMI